MEQNIIIIQNPPKSWYPGDARVEEFMPSVAEIIHKYHKWPSPEFTEIYNRVYEAVLCAIEKHSNRNKV